MYISYNWLQDFIKIPNKVDFQTIAEKLTLHTVEVENFIHQADRYKNITIAKVLEVKPHPNANKLQLAVVDVGDKQLNIVCGASNLKIGQIVPVARAGAILPNGAHIKENKIRGELSQGMICSEDELTIGSNHDGIMVLEDKAQVGGDFSDYLKLNDIIFEIDNKSMSNRADLFSHYGIARELSAIFNIKLKPYHKTLDPNFKLNINNKDLGVNIEDKQTIIRYSAIKIDNIKIEESPNWLKNRLIAINQKPVNNIVDLTNYIMFELGQPLHAFNAHKIRDIKVRFAQANERFVALDNIEYELIPTDVVISEGKKILALGGVIGSQDSGVNIDTNSIILESANFRAENIRQSSQRLNLRTEASTRFEKAVDPELTIMAINRFVSLLQVMQPEIKIKQSAFDFYPQKVSSKKIILNLKWLNKKIGQNIPQDQVESILQNLGFKITQTKISNEIEVIVPSWRVVKDISIAEDLVEEVLRMYGFNKINSSLPVETLVAPEINHELVIERKIKILLAYKFNLFEFHSYAFISEVLLNKLNVDYSNYLRLANPLSSEYNILKQSLSPSLIMNVKNNQHKASDFGFFEIANVFFNFPGSLNKDNKEEEKLPYQEKKLAISLSSKQGDLFTEAKDLIVSFCREIIGQKLEIIFEETDNFPGWSDKNRAAQIKVNQESLGYLALVNSESTKNINLKTKVVVIEISLVALHRIIKKQAPVSFSENIKYPNIIRDLSFVFSKKILYNDIKDEIIKFNPLIIMVELIDIYEGNKLKNNEKGLTFRLTFQAKNRTLVSSEVDGIQNSLINKINERFQAKLREV